ncbi:IQ domain-containing protein K isoform X2 [Erythrolamprus reginae]|uniref:IQ domain-containing protein K isoform X2 n=1 Tax=Erythrolamprus reginae TaxID=121349 RepID=UPI00396CDFC2
MATAVAEEAPLRGLWEQICAEFEAQQPVHPDHLEKKVVPPPPALQVSFEATEAARSLPELPELTGGESKPAITEEELSQKTVSLLSALIAPEVIAPEVIVPEVIAPEVITSEVIAPELIAPELIAPELPDLKTCTPREFLECYIFPVLLPGMVELLHEAKKQRCFERKQTRFIALDFLTEWLYNHNAKREGEPFVEFFEIPFVKEWLKDHPRPPIPLSLLLTEEEAGHIIQTFWKGYRVRCDPEVQELRQWQKHLRETKNIHKRVREFWANQEKKVGTKLEDSEHPSPNLSKTITVNVKDTRRQSKEEQLSDSKLAENSSQTRVGCQPAFH